MFSISKKAGYQTVETLRIFMFKIHRKFVRKYSKKEKSVVGVKVQWAKREW